MRLRAYRALCLGVSALAMSAASGFAAEPATPEQEMKFHAFLSDFRAEALKAGINADTYDRATSSIEIGRAHV